VAVASVLAQARRQLPQRLDRIVGGAEVTVGREQHPSRTLRSGDQSTDDVHQPLRLGVDGRAEPAQRPGRPHASCLEHNGGIGQAPGIWDGPGHLRRMEAEEGGGYRSRSDGTERGGPSREVANLEALEVDVAEGLGAFGHEVGHGVHRLEEVPQLPGPARLHRRGA